MSGLRGKAVEPATRPRVLTVAPGGDTDVCPRCGIWRVNAGYGKETCGYGYLKRGCFVTALDTGRGARPSDSSVVGVRPPDEEKDQEGVAR